MKARTGGGKERDLLWPRMHVAEGKSSCDWIYLEWKGGDQRIKT